MSDTVLHGLDATQIMGSPVHKRALAEIETTILRTITESKYDGSKESELYREKLCSLLHLNKIYQAILREAIMNGKVAEKSLERKESRTNWRGQTKIRGVL